MNKELTYEEALANLEKILEELQQPTQGLDDLSKKVEKGKELIEYCQTKLRSIEQNINQLLR